MRIRPGTVAGGLFTVVGVSLAVGALLAQPTFAAQPASAGSPAAAATTDATTTVTVAPPTVTGPGTWTGSGTPVPTAPATSSTACPSYPAPTLLPGGVALSTDFEDGTTGGWSASPGVTLTNTTEVAAGGTHSLRIDGLTSTAGVGVTVSRLPNWGWYRATARVRVPGDVPSASFVTLKPSSSAVSAIPGTARVSSDGWATVNAYFRPGTLSADWICNGVMTGTQRPAPTSIGLTVALITCDGATPIDRPARVYLDDVLVTGTPGTGTGTGTAPPTGDPTPTCGPTTTPPSTPPPAQCVARQTVQSQWPGGYVASVQLTNSSARTLTGWSLTWTFPGAQQVATLWGAGSWTQTGPQVSVTGPPWAPLAAGGGTATVGFVGQGTPGTLTAVTLDGMSCGVPAL